MALVVVMMVAYTRGIELDFKPLDLEGTRPWIIMYGSHPGTLIFDLMALTLGLIGISTLEVDLSVSDQRITVVRIPAITITTTPIMNVTMTMIMITPTYITESVITSQHSTYQPSHP